MPKNMNFNFVKWLGRLTDDHDNSREKKYFTLIPMIDRLLMEKKKNFNRNGHKIILVKIIFLFSIKNLQFIGLRQKYSFLP